MKIASWNVNSIRARHQRVCDWLVTHRPDVVAVQETKCTDRVFAALEGDYADLGYQSLHWGRDHWNGVAILSRVGISHPQYGFRGTNRAPFDEARLLTATCGGVRVASLYAPNGRSLDDPHYLFKLVWLERLRAEFHPQSPTAEGDVGNLPPVLLLGDFNVAPSDLDIYDPSRWRNKTHASPPERAALQALLDTGLVDVTREHLGGSDVFSWWSYRPGQFEKNRGLRIDLALCDRGTADRVIEVWIDTDERGGDRPSDHAPLVVTLDESTPT